MGHVIAMSAEAYQLLVSTSYPKIVGATRLGFTSRRSSTM